MKRINTTRVLLGGLAAGVLINLSEFVLWGIVLDAPYQAMMAQYGLGETSWAMTAYILGGLILGIAVAFTYAAMRPRFGPRWQTGVVAGAVIWSVGFALPMLFNSAIGLGVGAASAAVALVWGLAEMAAAGAVAGLVYQEQPAAAAAPAPQRY